MIASAPDHSWFWRLCAVIGVCSLCSNFQVYQTAVVNNLYDPAVVWLNHSYLHRSVNISIGRNALAGSGSTVGSSSTPRDLSAMLWSTFVASFPLGKFIGTAISAEILDTYGRRTPGV